MNPFQTKIEEAFQKAQTKAASRAREIEQETRKVLETLGDRAQAELKALLHSAQNSSREQMGIIGAELERLGRRLQEIAAAPVAPPPTPGAAAPADKPTQQPPESVQ